MRSSLKEKLQPLISSLDHFLRKPNITNYSAPFVRDHYDIKRMMILVVMALFPCIFMAVWNTGVQSFVYSSSALSLYLPLITVNCAILGATLFPVTREYPFITNCIFSLGCGIGWRLSIILIATLRSKMRYSDIPPHLQGMAITFIVTGLMALAFMGFTG